MQKRLFVAAAAAVMMAVPAEAHFQLLYTPEVNIEKPAELPFKLIFWHPLENGHAMDMGTPEDFYYLHKGNKKSLLDQIKPITFHGAHNDSKAYEASVKIRRNGDYIFALTPSPYYEKSEDIFIQQITKAFVNKGGVPTGWNEPIGLPTEIVPLNKPTNVIAGSTFSGILLSDGNPVPGAEIEIEYLAAEPDIATNKAGAATASPVPGGAIVAITDQHGAFTFGIPKSGFWGFAALGSGPKKEFKGKELSQDAVLWIRAYDFQ
jgi:cobalt/nickel transport protein